MALTHCPSCGGEIERDDPGQGRSIICTECGELLEVISTAPFEVDYPPGDDWDDEDYEDGGDGGDGGDGEDVEDDEDGEDIDEDW